MTKMDVLRFLRTVKHLKPVQVYGRLLFRAHKSAPRLAPAPPLRARGAAWIAPIERPITLIGPTRVRLLDREGSIETQVQWNDPTQEKLWLYNLHYFDDLNAIGASTRVSWHRALIGRWITENPPGAGVGWEPYPTSLRIVNWIKWGLCGAPMEALWCNSLAIQTRWLEKRIEWYLLGNHLLANAKALVFAGLFFDGPEAARWLSRGLDIYRWQLPEQILEDGGHFERSPMYHAIVLEDMLDLFNAERTFGIIREQFVSLLDTHIARMRAWLDAMSHPDGQISFFNDAAFGIAATPAEIENYATRLGLPPRTENRDKIVQLLDSGYVRLCGDDTVTIIDVAPIGPDYLPGHAHADTLSFEFSLGADRIVVNGGTSVYGIGPQRLLERSTAAHSSVEINGENSSEVWSGFRVGRRARIRDLSISECAGCVVVGAAHNGYCRLPGTPVHRRVWTFEAHKLIVRDTIEGRPQRAIARFHLGQDVQVQMGDDMNSGALVTRSGRRIAWRSSSPASAKHSEWHPEFGASVSISCLEIAFDASSLETEFVW